MLGILIVIVRGPRHSWRLVLGVLGEGHEFVLNCCCGKGRRRYWGVSQPTVHSCFDLERPSPIGGSASKRTYGGTRAEESGVSLFFVCWDGQVRPELGRLETARAGDITVSGPTFQRKAVRTRRIGVLALRCGIPSPSGMQRIGVSDALSMRQCCDVELLTRYFRPWGDTVVSSYVRFAAGVCVLSTGLFIGATGGAIAAADTDASDSSVTGDSGSTQGSDTPSSSVDSPMTSPVGGVADSLRKTFQGVMSTLGSGRTPGLLPSTGADSSTVETVASSETAEASQDSGAAVASPVEPVPTVVEPVANVVEPVPSVAEPAPTAGASAPTVVAAVPNVVVPVSTVVAGLVATTSDVITLVEDMLTSAAGAALVFTSLQPDLSALLGIAAADPVLAGVEGHGAMGPTAAADASLPAFLTALQSPVGAPQTGVPGVTWADEVAGAAPLGWRATTLLGQESPLAEASGSDGLIPVGVRKFFRQAFDEIRRSPALAALLLAALPGLGGLLVLTGAGTRLGYRQAKAGIALQTAGIARFARSGPLGVVRSGSLVYVRPRASRVVRPGTLGAGRFLDEAA
jgi:hypothetical protein